MCLTYREPINKFKGLLGTIKQSSHFGYDEVMLGKRVPLVTTIECGPVAGLCESQNNEKPVVTPTAQRSRCVLFYFSHYDNVTLNVR
jgi:hypothetical protein